MIVRNKKDHFEVEMFHKVQVGKRNPEADFNEYLVTLAKEFIAEINTHRFAIKHNIPYVPVTTSHHVVDDAGSEIKI